jgi:hypothetical protein
MKADKGCRDLTWDSYLFCSRAELTWHAVVKSLVSEASNKARL